VALGSSLGHDRLRRARGRRRRALLGPNAPWVEPSIFRNLAMSMLAKVRSRRKKAMSSDIMSAKVTIQTG
jgi:hypothetical protein